MRPAPASMLLAILLLCACGPERDESAPPATTRVEAPPAPTTQPPLLVEKLRDDPLSEDFRFRSGDNLDLLLRRAEIASEERNLIESALGGVFDLGRFRAGRMLSILREPDGRVLGVSYELDFLRDLCAWREGDGFQAAVFSADLDWRPRCVSAELDDSFYESLRRQGENGDLATRIADLFAGEVDFFFDLRPGDRMEMLLDSASRPDRANSRDRVLAARMIVSGYSHEAWLFPAEDGTRHYYHRDGSSLERRFLKAPVDFSRISSRFSHNRLHPVLGIRRPHYGVDYAAPTGTPVRATADGTIKVRSYQRDGAGRYLCIRHPGGIETTYMHLSSYAKGTGVGARVSKGQEIGYVGQTGLATGPHLDYRVKVSGRYINPRNFVSDSADPLSPERMPAFALRLGELSEEWASLSGIQSEETPDPDPNAEDDILLSGTASSASSSP